MTILVTAASGQLGALVVEALRERGVQPSEIVATSRDPRRLAHLAAEGVRTAELDYDKPDTIAAALEGVERVLLVSGSQPGARLAGHRNVIEAAARAGVAQLAYTSLLDAADADFVLAPDHKATEELLARAGVPVVLLRNGWYIENHAHEVRQAVETGVITHSAGSGVIASAARRDYAEAAAAVLTAPLEEYNGSTLELAATDGWSYDDLAGAVAEIVDREVRYERLDADEHVARLRSYGLDEGTAGFVAAIDDGVARGVLASTDPTLARVIGRPLTPREDVIRALLAA